MSTAASLRHRKVALAVCVTAALVALGIRWQNQEVLGPEIDRSALHYWTQSVLDAPEWGLGTLFSDPTELQRSPETKIYQLLGPAYLLPTRLTNLSSVLWIGAWDWVFGTSTTSAILFGWLQTLLIAAALAALTLRHVGFESSDETVAYLAATGVFLSVWANPFLLLQSTWASWHSTALCFLLIAIVAIPQIDGRLVVCSQSWSGLRRLLIGSLLVLTFYASYLVPTFLLPCWAVLALLPSARAGHWREFARESRFWLIVALPCLPAAAWIFLRPDSSTTWLSIWSGNPGAAAGTMVLKLVLGSCLLAVPGVIALFTKPRPGLESPARRSSPTGGFMELPRFLRPFLLINSILILFVLNAAPLDRLLLYLLPLNCLGAALIARTLGRSAVRRPKLVSSIALALLVVPAVAFGASMAPSRWIGLVTPNGHAAMRLAADAEVVASTLQAVLAPQELIPSHLGFRNRDIAGLLSVRLGITRVAISNLERLLDALEQGTVDAFLATRVPDRQVPVPLLIVADPETDNLTQRLGDHFVVERRDLGDLDWFVLKLTAR